MVLFPPVLPTICLHCTNAVVALRVIGIICGFQVSLLSRVTPNSLASLESSSFEPFIDKESKIFLRPPEKIVFFGEHLRLCLWSLALASSIPVLGLERVCPRKECPWPRVFVFPWPSRALCPRLHLCWLLLQARLPVPNKSVNDKCVNCNMRVVPLTNYRTECKCKTCMIAFINHSITIMIMQNKIAR